MLKAEMIKLVDNLIGRIVCRLFTRLKPGSGRPVTTILIIRPGGIGDAALLAPAIGLIKQHVPAVHITVLSENRNYGIFSLIPGVDRLLRYDFPLEFFYAIRLRYDVVIDTEQWYRLSAVVARLVRAPVKIGFGTNQRRRMFTHVVDYDLNTYEPDNFLALLKPLGLDLQRDGGAVSFSIPLQSLTKAYQLMQSLSSDPYVVIFPGASIEEKRWNVEHFISVAKRLTVEGFRVVVVGGRAEYSDGAMITGEVGLNLVNKMSLAETAAVISRSSLVISGDSGVLHIAVGLDIPTVSLFGPSSVKKWAPRGARHIVLDNTLSCSPCVKFGNMPPCPIEVRCIKSILPDEVMQAVRRLLLHMQ